MRLVQRFNKFFKRIKHFFLNRTNFQIILFVYALVVIVSTGLLYLPISHQSGQEVSFLDCLFTAASAFSDTGLTVKETVKTWSEFGQFIIAVLILIGGIGIFAMKVWIINVIFNKAISITSRNILEKERGSNNLGSLKKTIKISVAFIFITIIIATFVLWPIFYFEKGNFAWNVTDNVQNPFLPGPNGEFTNDYRAFDPYQNLLLSFKCAVFHAISAINNAGFDILSGSSLFPYYYVYSIQIVFIILLIIGGIGFPVIYDVMQFIYHKLRRRTDFKFSLFTKVSCTAYLIIFILGLTWTLIFEISNISKTSGIWNSGYTGTIGDKIMCIFFHVFSTRNAGFTTLDPNLVKFTSPSLVIFSILMFIGSAPSSTAGGIRTTTIAIVVVAIWNKIRGVKSVRMFKRKINSEIVNSAFIVVSISVIIVLTTSLICFTSLDNLWGNAPSKDITFADVFYEVCSAFGTTGLSTGLTPNLNVISKLAMVITMFIGQLGVSSTMIAWRKENSKNNYSYIEEDIIIG